ncbi:ectonucleotide pyrophosphatase/phosphodiesterase family member 1-like [Pollicipes pollicipes]|uniref:ectonucleotide pyrophosphatase/phosphodiesterase family member 1-like n=1 Tax=Pollicipes pollicipes TaxID=41117 RepID=UPI00188497DE|nr:ectonucleotide pyrophosphatase/phosphodiesterase family member 1-like [Pollicipes pollicipes]
MLQDMLDCGVTAPYVRTSFPSKTFPNHYSIATGMYPESNGIVGNRMYDTALPGRRFKLGKQESLRPVWWRAEPVWETVRKMGGVSAVFFWPGSEVPGRLPTHYKRYDSKVPYEQRVTQIIDWLLLPEPKRPRYLSLYFEEPDKSGHSYGPNSEQVKAAVDRVDAQLASLYSQLMEHDLLGCVDVTVSSDHGMATVREDCESVILDDYVPGLSKNSTYVNGPVTRVRPDNQSSVNDLVEQLDCAHPALRVLHRDELPERWHYQQSSRIEPIIATVDQGYGMSVPSSDFCIRGMHGYDNDLVDMRSFFVAHGPSFKRNFTADPFENIQLYSLFQTLLGLPDIENNATKHSLDHLLVSPPSDRTPIGPAPVAASPPLEQTLTNPCCTELDNCRCQALEEWLAGTKNVSGTLPLPVSGRDVLLDVTVDGSFAAEPSPKPSRSYRWLQYYLERDSNGSLTMPPLPAADSQCLFQSSGRPGPVQGCSVDSAYRSLVHTGGTDSYLGRLAASMYPMYPAYQERVLPELLRRLETYSRRYGLVAVLAGPVYRSEALDRFGQPIPSHFFYQLRMCGGRGCRPEEIVHKQWILPHKERFRPCEAAGKYVNFHEATLRDVERVSGLTLFAGQLASQPDSAHGSHARFITQLPELRPPLTWSN